MAFIIQVYTHLYFVRVEHVYIYTCLWFTKNRIGSGITRYISRQNVNWVVEWIGVTVICTYKSSDRYKSYSPCYAIDYCLYQSCE